VVQSAIRGDSWILNVEKGSQNAHPVSLRAMVALHARVAGGGATQPPNRPPRLRDAIGQVRGDFARSMSYSHRDGGGSLKFALVSTVIGPGWAAEVGGLAPQGRRAMSGTFRV